MPTRRPRRAGFILMQQVSKRQNLCCIKIRPYLQSEEGTAEEGPTAGGVMDMDSSSKEMPKTSFIQGGLAHGTHKAAKPSGKQQTHHYVLASI